MPNETFTPKPGQFVTTEDGQFVTVMYVKLHGSVTYVGLSNGRVVQASTLKKF